MDDVTQMVIDRIDEMDTRIDARFGRIEARLLEIAKSPTFCERHQVLIEGLLDRQTKVEKRMEDVEDRMERVAAASGRTYAIMGGIAAVSAAMTLALQWIWSQIKLGGGPS